MQDPIGFDEFEWLDAQDSELPRVVEELQSRGLGELAERLQTIPVGRPFSDLTDSAIVAALRFPTLHAKSGLAHPTPAVLRLAITPGLIVTIRPREFPSIDKVRRAVLEGRRTRSMTSARFAGDLLMEVVGARFEFVEELAAVTAELENGVFGAGRMVDLIQELMSLKLTLSKARQIALPQREVLGDMARDIQRMQWSDDGIMQDVGFRVTHVILLLDGLNDRADIVTQANEAFLNHSLNSTLKLLTIFSVLMITPTFVASIFGMNVNIPLVDHPQGFLIVSAIIGATTLIGVAFLKFRRWL